MIEYLKSLYRAPSPVMMARKELEDAQRNLLQAQSATEYARRMAEYHQDRIKRLTAYLRDAHPEGDRHD